MHTEYEARVLEVNLVELEQQLKKLGATYVGEFTQYRYVYDVKPKQEGKWIRLRKTNDKTTVTIKNIENKGISGTKELEIKVDNFEKMNLFLEELGYKNKSYQENKRISYILDEVEIDIDFWPLIPTYIEVEGPNESSVLQVIKKLGYAVDEIVTLNVNEIYRKYGYELEEIKELRFDE